jgi:hypothetical protein
MTVRSATPRFALFLAAIFVVTCARQKAPVTEAVQTIDSDRAAVVAVADSALAAVSHVDFKAVSALMLDESVMMSAGMRNGMMSYGAQNKLQVAEAKRTGTMTERGFSPSVHVSGPLAVVWYPYDFYLNGQWSHCGVDSFTMLKVGGRWRISSLQYSVEQPPACAKHPNGPPR